MEQEEAKLADVDISKISDISEIKRVYGSLQKWEQSLDAELDEILASRNAVDARILSVQRLVPDLDALGKEASHLAEVISSTSVLAEKVSSKVRQLDLAKSRVQDAIKRVDDILDLKSCVEGVHSAFLNEEFEQAAAFIHRYLSLDERALREILPVDTEETDLNASFTYLHEAQSELQDAVRRKFDDAVVQRRKPQVERFFKLFPLVGLPDEGLLKFSKYLRTQIADSCELNLDAALHISPNDRRANVIFADTLTLLFEGIARSVEDHQPLVDTYYGPGKMLAVLQELQSECDSQSKYIIQQFLNSRKFQELCDDLAKSPKAQKGSEGKERLDPKELDVLLGEIVLLSARMEMYLRFLRKRVQADIESLPVDERSGDMAAVQSNIVSNSGLSRKMQTLMGDYVVMESYFMREMMLKAVSMDASDKDSLTSSMVDDIFFVLQKSLRRTLSTSNIDIMCAVLNNASSLLLADYKDVLKSRLKSHGYSSSSLDLTGMLHGKIQTGLTSMADVAEQKKSFLVVLNNIDVSSEYLKKLVDLLVVDSEQVMKGNDCSKEKLESCLIDLGASSQMFKELLQAGLSQLCSQSIMPRLSSALDGFASISHVLTEADFQVYELNDPFVQNFIATLDATLSALKSSLTHANYESVVGLTCHEIAVRLEKVAFKLIFNRLGGLQFDKELRSLVGYLTSITEWTVRDKFARLTQIATILNLDRVSELLEYWGENSGSLTWRLTPAEVRQVLSLRSDFKKEDIQRLKL